MKKRVFANIGKCNCEGEPNKKMFWNKCRLSDGSPFNKAWQISFVVCLGSLNVSVSSGSRLNHKRCKGGKKAFIVFLLGNKWHRWQLASKQQQSIYVRLCFPSTLLSSQIHFGGEINAVCQNSSIQMFKQAVITTKVCYINQPKSSPTTVL